MTRSPRSNSTARSTSSCAPSPTRSWAASPAAAVGSGCDPTLSAVTVAISNEELRRRLQADGPARDRPVWRRPAHFADLEEVIVSYGHGNLDTARRLVGQNPLT